MTNSAKQEAIQALFSWAWMHTGPRGGKPGEMVAKLLRGSHAETIRQLTDKDFNHPMEIKKLIGENPHEKVKREFREFVEKRGNKL